MHAKLQINLIDAINSRRKIEEGSIECACALAVVNVYRKSHAFSVSDPHMQYTRSVYMHLLSDVCISTITYLEMVANMNNIGIPNA